MILSFLIPVHVAKMIDKINQMEYKLSLLTTSYIKIIDYLSRLIWSILHC